MKNRIFYIALAVAIVLHLSFFLVLRIKLVQTVFVTESELLFWDSSYSMFKPFEEHSLRTAEQEMPSFFVLPGVYQKTASSDYGQSIAVLKKDSAAFEGEIFKEENKLISASMSFIEEQAYTRPSLVERIDDRGDTYLAKLLDAKKQIKIFMDKNMAYLFETEQLIKYLKKKGFESNRLYDINVTFYNKRLFLVRAAGTDGSNINRQITEVFKKALKRSVQVPEQLNGKMLLTCYD
jgi:hypothetical protein